MNLFSFLILAFYVYKKVNQITEKEQEDVWVLKSANLVSITTLIIAISVFFLVFLDLKDVTYIAMNLIIIWLLVIPSLILPIVVIFRKKNLKDFIKKTLSYDFVYKVFEWNIIQFGPFYSILSRLDLIYFDAILIILEITLIQFEAISIRPVIYFEFFIHM